MKGTLRTEGPCSVLGLETEFTDLIQKSAVIILNKPTDSLTRREEMQS